MRDAFYAALGAAGLGAKRESDHPMVFHDLRHTFGTLAVGAWDLPKVQAAMGHANITTTMIYVHAQPRSSDADALTRLVAAGLSTEEVEANAPAR
jgi:integrase